MAREWIKITLSYLFLHILAPLHCRERNTRSSRIEAEPCTQVPRQKCALDAHSAPHGMTALPEVQRQQWVGLRLSQTVRTLLWGQADGTVQAIAVSENSPTCGTFIIPMRYARRVSFQFR